ncbi:M28 family metallopeptidase [Conexibacter sp. SYSU D00693]|uniref:M28 family metallopeptidase n=1 Tax=Conexibacter sp. SYSU D00693 TaxID=2812560 RepID=UPI00196B6C77|nr:M28 family metallopeptidase [Conexibacter sp. SYSU D00693]
MHRLPLAAVLVAALVGCGSGGDDGQDAPVGAGAGAGEAGVTTADAAAARPPDRFSATRAMATVRLQLAAGQRPAGSAALRRLAPRLRDRLPRGRFEAIPGHPGLRNVVGRIPGSRPAIVVGAHYDTEALPKGFVGANDSAAGTAALIEVSRALRKVRRPAGAPEIRFVLFDGEEEPRPTDDFYRDALRGSKAYAAAHADEVGAMVLLDYVANEGLQLPREGTSDPGLWARLRAAARRVGKQAFFPDATGQAVLDDHTPFLRAGVPSIDLIDFTYEHADTLQDTYDKLDPRAMDAVGETVVELVRTIRTLG